MTREKFPEKIPFRLTRMLTNAMEVSGSWEQAALERGQHRPNTAYGLACSVLPVPQNTCVGSVVVFWLFSITLEMIDL